MVSNFIMLSNKSGLVVFNLLMIADGSGWLGKYWQICGWMGKIWQFSADVINGQSLSVLSRQIWRFKA